MAPPNPPMVAFDAVTKRFPGVTAVDQVSLDIPEGCCMALVGENGAGKSTLGKLLAGLYTPDEGSVRVRGLDRRIDSPLTARSLGIGMVHQELAFCPNLSVAENLCLGGMPRRGPFTARRAMALRARTMLERVGADFDVAMPMARLSTGQEQLVQIAAAVGHGARILVFDEPTSSLSQAESERLFNFIGELKRQGVTILYVSHRLEEVFRLCDRVAVLRDSRLVKEAAISEVTPDTLVTAMIGRPLEEYFPNHVGGKRGPELLRVERLSSPGRFENISFSVYGGEVLGLAGLVGAGRSECAAAIMGLDPHATGKVYVRGEPVGIRSARDALRAGIGLAPEDRKRQGLFLGLSLRHNISLAILRRLARGPFVRQQADRALAAAYVRKLRIRTPRLDAPTLGLSGGNQQKVVLAKWLAAEVDVLILDEPTRGIDVGAKAEIHGLIDEMASSGKAVVLISSDLPEVLNLSTRILVLRRGRTAGELNRAGANQDALLRLMAGLRETESAGSD